MFCRVPAFLPQVEVDVAMQAVPLVADAWAQASDDHPKPGSMQYQPQVRAGGMASAHLTPCDLLRDPSAHRCHAALYRCLSKRILRVPHHINSTPHLVTRAANKQANSR